MARIVQKFGGTSVANVERIRNVATKVKREIDAGNEVAVVVSAMAGTADQLVAWTRDIAKRADPREYDVVVSTGEQVTIGLLAMAMHAQGVKAKSFTGSQVTVLTDSTFTKARILRIDEERIRKALAEGNVVVVAGFQGADAHGNITTLGRGGSDTSAVALAAALKADECQIYTDVDGVYTT
ncbi:MAG: aspartate kinase, partial [Flavobacteriales bacterium]|nr:aspartate kinase [Flavobacteriales bacterium]